MIIKSYGLHITDVLKRELAVITPDSMVSDIMSIAAESPYPIAVVGEDEQRIVTKASELSLLL